MNRSIGVDSIVILENRQRSHHGIEAHQELVESIQSHGLLHAPVLRYDGERYILVAGERRIRAMRDIWELGGNFKYDGEVVIRGMVPHILLSELDELTAEEAELEENIRRLDITWQERVAATAKIVELRKKRAIQEAGEEPSTRAVLTELHGDEGTSEINQGFRDLQLARVLTDPDIAKAKTMKEAQAILKKKEVAKHNEKMAAMVGQQAVTDRYQLINKDCIEALKSFPDGLFGGICSDPPYGMGADSFGNFGGTTGDAAHFYLDDYDSWSALMLKLLPESFRVTKDDAFMYLFCDIRNFFDLQNMAEQAGWRVFQTPLLWVKRDGFNAPWPNKGPQRKYEAILYAVKGDRGVNFMKGDVLDYAPDTNIGHPAQKPVALISDLLGRSALPGEHVLDPFAGSGPIVPAAVSSNLYVTAIERDAAAFGMMAKRVEQLK